MSDEAQGRWRAHYEAFYRDGLSGEGGGDLARWRALSAEAKARNIEAAVRALGQPVPHATVLEVGAGEGGVLLELVARGFARDYAAVDVAETALARLRERATALYPALWSAGALRAQAFDGDRLPFPDQAFDLVILSHVVEHLEEPRRVLREAGRVGRHVFVEVPLEDTTSLPFDYRPTPVGHINVYSPRTIRWLLQTSDLEVLAQRETVASREAHRFQSGLRGLLAWSVKDRALRWLPSAAPRLFTYHGWLLARRQAP